MEPLVSYIVMQCHGDKSIFSECMFALMTLSKWTPPSHWNNKEIWIYSDDPEWFASFDCPLPLHFRKIDSDIVKKWKGDIDFIHRVKIEVLLDFTANRTGNILYFDTDILFLQAIEPVWAGIGNGDLYMCVMEGKLMDENQPNLIIPKLASFIRKNSPLKIGEETLNISPQVAMWNAGVIGFNTSYRHILEKALVFTDAIYPRFPKHIVEQFAFSLYLQQQAPLKAATSYLIHYWNMKEVRPLLNSFFQKYKGKSWSELIALSEQIQIPLMMQDKINFLYNTTLLDKILKKKWKPEIPELDVQG